MRDLKETCKIAVVQAEPVMFDKKKGLEKVLGIIEEAASHGVEFIVFPELFIPGYPFGMTFGFTVGSRAESGRQDWKLYYDQSLIVPGGETKKIGEYARKYNTYISIGVSERDGLTGTLYNTNLLFKADGTLDSVHRKLKPTGTERVVWGDADRGYFPTMDTPWGPVGSLICWESYMPLARMALYEKGITLYISPNTNDNPEWQSTIQHIALEGKVYFINSDMIIRRSSYPGELLEQDRIGTLNEIVCRGGSCIVDPYGHYVIEPVWDKEEILYAELDLQEIPRSKMEFDVCGHYARPDVFSFKVVDK